MCIRDRLWGGGLGNTLLAQSQPVTVEAAPEKQKPSAYLLTQKVTAGMTNLTASMRFDSSIKYAEYKLYQFDGDTLNAETAEVLVSGGLYRSQTNQTLYVGVGRLKAVSYTHLDVYKRQAGLCSLIWQKCASFPQKWLRFVRYNPIFPVSFEGGAEKMLRKSKSWRLPDGAASLSYW